MLLTPAILNEFDSWLTDSSNPKLTDTVCDQFQTGLYSYNFQITQAVFDLSFHLIERHKQKLGDKHAVTMRCELMRAYLKSEIDDGQSLSVLFGDSSEALSKNLSYGFPNALPILRTVCEQRLDQLLDSDLKRFMDNVPAMTRQFTHATSHFRGQTFGPVTAFMADTSAGSLSSLRQDQGLAALIRFAFDNSAEAYEIDHLVSGGVGAHHMDVFAHQLVRVRDLGSKLPMREHDVLVVTQAVDRFVRVIGAELDSERRAKLAQGLEALLDITLKDEGAPLASKQNYFRMRNEKWANGEMCDVINQSSKLLVSLPASTGSANADKAVGRFSNEMLLAAVQALPALSKTKQVLFTEYAAPRLVQAGYRTLDGDKPLKRLSVDERSILIRMVPPGPILNHLLDQYPSTRRDRVESDFAL